MYQSLFKKFKFIPILILLTGILYFSVNSSPNRSFYRNQLNNKINTCNSFNEFTSFLFQYETTRDSITTAYTLKKPSKLQIPYLKPSISSFSYSDYKKEKNKNMDYRLYESYLKTLSNFNQNKLSQEEQITYSLLNNSFKLNKELSKFSYYDDLLAPSSGVQANLPITLCEYPLYTEKNLNTYLSLLKQIPNYYHEIIQYQKQRSKLGFSTPTFLLYNTQTNLKTMINSLKKDRNCFTDTFHDRLLQIDDLPFKKRQYFEKRNRCYIKKYVLPAYENLLSYINDIILNSEKTSTSKYSKHIDSSKSSYCVNKNLLPLSTKSYGLSSYSSGKDYYSLLVKYSTGSSHSVPELISKTDQTLKQTLDSILNLALSDSEAYLYYCEHPLKTPYESPEGILQALSLMIHKDYPQLMHPPTYQLKNVPKSLQASSSPAFYMIPAIDNYQNNTIYINPLHLSKENGSLFTTLAHEGFPGHMYQTVFFNESKPSPIRQILNYPGYSEGWATYVEINSFNFLKYPRKGTSLQKLYQADTIINLALCSRIDLGVNYENWTLNDVDHFFKEHGFNSYYAPDIYSYVVESPSNYLSYFIGYLEILDLKETFKRQEMQNYSEKEFHKRLLEIGPGDFSTIESFLLKK